ncbi:hypothetical protein KEM54_005990, partial [Ascosphaera aggregata]
FGGLKRLSTIMGRRKSTLVPPLPSHQDGQDAPPPPQSHHEHGHLAAPGGGSFSGNDTLSKKSKRNSFMPFRRNNDITKQSFQSIDSQPQLHRRSDSVTSIGDDPNDLPVRVATPGHDQGEQKEALGLHPAPDSILELPEPGEGHQNWLQSQSARQPQTDADGFTVRLNVDDEITKVQREAAAAAARNFDEEHAIRIRDQKIEEDEGAAQQAMTQMANALRIQAEQSGLRSSGTIRGRREARNMIFGPSSNTVPPTPPDHAHGRPYVALNVDNKMSGMTVPSSNSPYAMPPQPHSPQSSQLSRPPRTGASLSSDQDSTSVYSTVRRTRATVFKHPEMHAPGLNVSLIECLSSRITETTVVTSLLGEIALACNPTEQTQQDVKIRLDNYTITERVAANPAYATPTEKAGEYTLDLSKLLRPTPQVVFKQSVLLDSQQLDAHSPVIFKPLWHLQDFQASVIVDYEVNPAFLLTVPGDTITLTNVRITVNLDTKSSKEGAQQTPARAVSAITYPSESAKFNQRRSAVTWEFPTLDAPAQGEESKLLARFGCSTPGPKAGHVNVSFDFVTGLSAEVTSPRLGVSMLDEQGRKTDKNPFADDIDDDNTSEDAWKKLPTTWTLKASKYTVN